jgi:hypothetical protein
MLLNTSANLSKSHHITTLDIKSVELLLIILLIQGLATGWMIGVNSQQGLGIFLFDTVSRPTLEPTQPPIQWVLGALSLGVKEPECEADHLTSV